jgi:hypothetical protein
MNVFPGAGHFAQSEIHIGVTLKAKARCSEAKPIIILSYHSLPFKVHSDLNNRLRGEA